MLLIDGNADDTSFRRRGAPSQREELFAGMRSIFIIHCEDHSWPSAFDVLSIEPNLNVCSASSTYRDRISPQGTQIQLIDSGRKPVGRVETNTQYLYFDLNQGRVRKCKVRGRY